MKMLSPNHCVVVLLLDHPILGVLEIATVQRVYEECETIVQTKKITWQSLTLEVMESHKITQEQLPNLLGRAYYRLIIKDPMPSSTLEGSLCQCAHEQCGTIFQHHGELGETTCCPECFRQQTAQPPK